MTSWYQTPDGVEEIERDGYLLLDGRDKPEGATGWWRKGTKWAALIRDANPPSNGPELSTAEIAPAAPNHGRGPTWWESGGDQGHTATVDFDLFDTSLDYMTRGDSFRPETSACFTETPRGWRLESAISLMPAPPWIHGKFEDGGPWFDLKSETEYHAQLVASAEPPCDTLVFLRRACDEPHGHLVIRESPGTSPADLWAFFRRLRNAVPWYDQTEAGSPGFKSSIPDKNRDQFKDDYLDMLEERGIVDA